MNEVEQSPASSFQELTEDEFIQEYLNRADAAWCLRSLALIASQRLEGDSDEAVQRLYESSGGRLNATTARCFRSDCNVIARIASLVESTPENCSTHIELIRSVES